MIRLKKKGNVFSPQRGVFVGRLRELDVFCASVRAMTMEHAETGTAGTFPHMFLVQGNDGMGKSALLRQFVHIAAGEGFSDTHIFLLDVSRQKVTDADTLVEQVAEAVRIKHPQFDLRYQAACKQRDALLPRYRALHYQWAYWQALSRSNSEAMSLFQSSSDYAEPQRVVCGKISAPGHIDIPSAVETAELTAILEFYHMYGQVPSSFDALLQYALGNDAALFRGYGVGYALADDLSAIATQSPLLLVIDGYEGNDRCDQWLHRVLVAKHSNQLLMVLASRESLESRYRHTLTARDGEMVFACNVNNALLQQVDIETYLKVRVCRVMPEMANLSPEEQEAAANDLPDPPPALVMEVQNISRGVPLVIGALGDCVVATGTVAPYRGIEVKHWESEDLVRAAVLRFLRSVLDNPQDDVPTREQGIQERQYIRALAVLRRFDAEILWTLWELSPQQGEKVLVDMMLRHSFVFQGEPSRDMHTLVWEIVRDDTLTEKYRLTDWAVLKHGLGRALPLLQQRVAQHEQGMTDLDARYHHTVWCEAVLDLLNALLWLNDEDAAHRLLLNRWIEARCFNPTFAAALATLAFELAPRTPDWKRLISAVYEDEDLSLLEPFTLLLEPHARVVLFYLQAQQLRVWHIENQYDLKQMNHHVVLLEQGYALDTDWQLLHQALAEAYAVRGRYYAMQRDTRAALENYDRSLALRPEHAATLTNRGIAKHYLGDDSGALEDYTHSLVLRPDHAMTLTNRGVTKYYLGDDEGALDDYNRSLVLRANHAVTLYNRGVVRRMVGDLHGALEDVSNALLLKPNDADSLNIRGVVYEQFGNYEQALADLDTALLLRVDDADILSHRGVVKERLGDYAGALQDFDRSLAIRPYDASTLGNRGVARMYLGDYAGALKDYDRSLMLRPDHGLTLDNRGVAKVSLGQYDAAQKDYEQAMHIAPDDASPLYNMACLYAVQGKGDVALDWLARAIQLNDTMRMQATHDSDFQSLHSDARFVVLVDGKG